MPLVSHSLGGFPSFAFSQRIGFAIARSQGPAARATVTGDEYGTCDGSTTISARTIAPSDATHRRRFVIGRRSSLRRSRVKANCVTDGRSATSLF